MRYFPFVLLLATPFLVFGAISKGLNQTLQSLQQIRSLIPERFTEEEFEIVVDRRGLEKSQQEVCAHRSKKEIIPPVCSFGDSSHYLLRWTFSGEAVRILDSYLEFEYGPYWKYPTALERLEEMDHGTYKVDR